MMDEAELADLGLLALQGVESAIHQVSIGLLATDSLRPGCVHSLLQPLAASGRQWQWLEHRVSVLLATSEPPPDPCLQALAAAVQGLLQHKAKALQGLPGAIAERRRGDAAALARRAAPMRVPPLPASIHLTHSDAPLPATQPRLTLLEVVVHTEKLRANLDTLAAVCLLGKGQNDQTRSGDQAQMTEGGSSLSGPALLTWLHDRLQDADASTTPILQELFCAAMAPFLAHMRAWAFRTGRLPQLHPDWGACSDEPSELLALLQPQDSAFQVLPGPLPTFLRPLEDAYMQTGLQLRMLQRLQPSGADTVDRMTVSAAAEAAMVSELAAGQDSLVSGASSSFQAIGSEDKSTAAACAVSFDPTKLPQVVARQSQGVAERRVAMLSLLHERAEAERAHKAQLQVKVQQARHQQTELRELAEVERQAASSRLRLGKLSRLRQLQAAAQARRSAAATERAESRALEQELMEQNALRELERAKVETEQLLQQRQKEVREMAQQAFRASWQGARWSLATSRSSQHKAREEEESAEASRRASFASTPMTGLSPVAVVDAYILDPFFAQHRCISRACVRLLLYELPALLSSLRSVYMAAAGDFFSTLAEGLTAQTLLAPSLTERAVQGLLDTSSRGSSIQGDPVATSLQGNLICHTEQGTSQAQPARWLASVATDAGAVGALDAVVLHVPIAWPLSAVVGGHEVQQYQAIFSRLLCLQRPLTLLHSLWRHLSRLQGGQSRLRGGQHAAGSPVGCLASSPNPAPG
ncbi:hypothetical protein WJX84_009308 [Apatococcus fuscideae]|uniref:Gamma-tubulin complex component n=1 Tax=Apatococcus fuscideae TaxID=2026836 RepID=A0AAW1TFU6_9CHLO